MPKAPKSLDKTKKSSLYKEIIKENGKSNSAAEKKPKTARKTHKEIQRESEQLSRVYLDSKSSERILKLARLQRSEEQESDTISEEEKVDDFPEVDWDENDEFVEIPETDENIFKSKPLIPSQNLADIILQKIQEKSISDGKQSSNFPSKVIQVYTKISELLSHYKSGKIPKAFKIIPSLVLWEEVLLLTRPDLWTPQATFEATRIFISVSSSSIAQRFLNVVLLEKVKNDISENKKLNYHYYQALRKGLYKPAAWFKGILFPLVKNNCTLREARIIGSIIAKSSIPVLHSAAAILRLTEIEPNYGANSLFIRLLLEKKYALPFKVLDALVIFFNNWRWMDRELAVLEHQCLLIFVQRYRNDITSEQKEALMAFVREKGHYQIGLEIKREIENSVDRGIEIPIINMQDL